VWFPHLWAWFSHEQVWLQHAIVSCVQSDFSRVWFQHALMTFLHTEWFSHARVLLVWFLNVVCVISALMSLILIRTSVITTRNGVICTEWFLQSVTSTRTNEIYTRRLIFTCKSASTRRRMWFLIVVCDFNTLKFDFNTEDSICTLMRVIITRKSVICTDWFLQSVISTRTNGIFTRNMIFTRRSVFVHIKYDFWT
jgi:hypothetical protein